MVNDIIILDPYNEYDELVKMLGGKVLRVSSEDAYLFNPVIGNLLIQIN